jgi:hypothetical protein
MNGQRNPDIERQGEQPPEDKTPERHPTEADEDQLDNAVEETFPASDPISP